MDWWEGLHDQAIKAMLETCKSSYTYSWQSCNSILLIHISSPNKWNSCCSFISSPTSLPLSHWCRCAENHKTKEIKTLTSPDRNAHLQFLQLTIPNALSHSRPSLSRSLNPSPNPDHSNTFMIMSDNITFEILQRLPLESILRFKSV